VIVLITAFGADEVVERAIAMGACAALDKPFELGRLVDAVFGTV
jgi:AmiR/NasT family two-component response regulator